MARFATARSTEAPMDFEYTSQPSAKPVWANGGDDPSTPRKRNLHEANPPAPAFPMPHTPMFGANNNVPFLFQQPLQPSSPAPAWVPPSNFSPVKAFPQPELKDVDMSEPSPPKPSRGMHESHSSKEAESERSYAVGGMRRVFKERQKQNRRAKSRSAEDESSDDESGNGDVVTPVQTTSNHYTLNMPAPAPPQSDLPYVLLGYVQFFFNGSLVVLFLYVAIQFIRTVQHDVEMRVSEYSMDVVQEITQCSLQYRTNLCETNPIPALAHQCAMWESCMNRDPSKVGRAKVSAETIGEVLNGFVDPISWKTWGFFVTSTAFVTVFINSLLSLFRSRSLRASLPPQAHQPSPIPSFPMTPVAPYQHHQYLSPPSGWQKSGKSDEVAETPSRRRRLEGGLASKIQ